MEKEDFLIFSDRDEWRAWLEINAGISEGIWVGYFKKHTGKKSVTYNEAVEEAICFGWIDSLIKRVDDNIYKQKYTPRKKDSVWSITNVRRAEKMIREKKITPRGLEMIKHAKKNGNWESAYGKKEESEVPEELLELLKRDEQALTNFFNYTQSIRNRFIYWINMAKRPETREKRAREVADMAHRNFKPGI